MTNLNRALLGVPAAAIVALACVWIAWPGTSDAADSDLPGPVAALSGRGLDIVKEFDAPSGLTGYAATFRGQPVAIYLTSDGEHAIVGTMVDGQGNDVSAEPLQRIVSGPKNKKAWRKLESSAWVRDGARDAEVIVYEFTDPNCPYCHKFWQAARPWVDAGKVQVRHVMVGILKPSSAPKAATILAAQDPEAKFTQDQKAYSRGGIDASSDLPEKARAQVNENNQLMRSLGYSATPTILYKTGDGHVASQQGLPRGSQMQEIMGGSKP